MYPVLLSGYSRKYCPNNPEYAGRDAKVVLDPCLLLDDNEWLNVEVTPNVRYKYIYAKRFRLVDIIEIQFTINILKKVGFS